MSKVAVVFWSGTGNTAAMATAVEEGAKAAGAQLAYECVMANNAPNDDDIEECKSLGRALA